MTDKTSKKTIFNNKHKRVNCELFDEIRLVKGLSRLKLATEVELSPQTVTRVLSGGDSRPSTVKIIGDFLGISANEWYISIQNKES